MKYVCFLLLIVFVSCSPDDGFDSDEYIALNYEEGEEFPVSDLSIEAFTADKAFGRAIPGLTDLELSFFGIGNAMFDQSWVSSPASTTSRDGLGPIFNARACSGCHLRDGRGKPLLTTAADSEGFLLRVGVGNDPIHGPVGFSGYGDQLQDDSNLGIEKEGDIEVTFEYINGTYPDGTAYQLRKPKYVPINGSYGDFSGVETSPRVGTQVIGLGFIDALTPQSILANADPQDVDNDGISGKANYVWDVKTQTSEIGRFGWKANMPNLAQQVAGAFNGDMGLTTSLFPDENCPDGLNCDDMPNGVNAGETVEVPDEQFSRIMVYQAAISVPIRKEAKELEVLQGKVHFKELGCVKCHTNEFTTGNYGLLPQLSGIKIRPYSDFLLHDMGEGLADGKGDFLADGNEWRTQPLWGLGLIEMVNGHTFLLHDGRARNIEEAVLWHGGEARKARDGFMVLSKDERGKLLTFLESL